MCLQEEDNVEHLVLRCVYAREVWYLCGLELGVPIPKREVWYMLNAKTKLVNGISALPKSKLAFLAARRG